MRRHRAGMQEGGGLRHILFRCHRLTVSLDRLFRRSLVHLYNLTAEQLDALFAAWKFLAYFLLGVSVGAGWCMSSTHN